MSARITFPSWKVIQIKYHRAWPGEIYKVAVGLISTDGLLFHLCRIMGQAREGISECVWCSLSYFKAMGALNGRWKSCSASCQQSSQWTGFSEEESHAGERFEKQLFSEMGWKWSISCLFFYIWSESPFYHMCLHRWRFIYLVLFQ